MTLDLFWATNPRALCGILRRRFKSGGYRLQEAKHPEKRQLLVDVSTILREDARTGIQRVVRALLGKLVAGAGDAIRVQPVFASRDHGYCLASLNPDGSLRSATGRSGALQPVTVRRGDIFLGLDLTANILPFLEAEIAQWRRAGVAIYFMIYDLLPLLQPDWFPPRTSGNIRRWLHVIARQADGCICISGAVAASLRDVLSSRSCRETPGLSTIPLGADLVSSLPSKGFPPNRGEIQAWLKRQKVLLTVGTVEPRKGHDALLSATTHLWQTKPQSEIALLLVGKPGWKTEKLQEALLRHPENGRRLLWLDKVSDEFLAELYESANGFIAPSRGEGFGLPLIEALSAGLPVLARDLPVFREIGGTMFDYFDCDDTAPLADSIWQWSRDLRKPLAGGPRSPLPSWADSAAELVDRLGIPELFDFRDLRN